MVKLNKIYTRTGDGGETSLVNGMRVAKHAFARRRLVMLTKPNSGHRPRSFTANNADTDADAGAHPK